MPFEAGLSRTWYNKGKKKAATGKYADMYDAWHSASGKPTIPGKRVEAQESFYQGYMDGESRHGNPMKGSLNKWINASAVRVRRSGGQLLVDLKVRGIKALGGKPRRRNVAAGFYDDEGIFHPIRASYDYKRSAAGEKPKKRRKSTRRKSRRK